MKTKIHTCILDIWKIEGIGNQLVTCHKFFVVNRLDFVHRPMISCYPIITFLNDNVKICYACF